MRVFFIFAFLKNVFCHTEQSEVSIKSKRGYFANAQYDSSGVDFSLCSKWQCAVITSFEK